MLRNPPPRRRTISEGTGRPLFDQPFDRLDLWTLAEATFDEARKAAKGGPKIGKTERTAHMAKIQDIYNNEVGPAAKREHPAGAQDVYNTIVGMLKAAENKGISGEEVSHVIKVMDGIRQAWAENPHGPHRLGPHVFNSEKENLASYFAQWMVAGLIGHSKVGDRQAGFGSHQWINSPDSGGTATGGPGGGGAPRGNPMSHTEINRPRVAGHGVTNVGESVNPDSVANLITEDVNDTWYAEEVNLDEDTAPQERQQGQQEEQGADPKELATTFAEADRAAGIVRARLESLIKSGGITPEIKQKFLQFTESINRALGA